MRLTLMIGKGRPMPLDAIRIAPKTSVFEGRVIWIAVAVGLMLAGCAKAPKPPPPAPPPPADGDRDPDHAALENGGFWGNANGVEWHRAASP